jgi:hypothetical protein
MNRNETSVLFSFPAQKVQPQFRDHKTASARRVCVIFPERKEQKPLCGENMGSEANAGPDPIRTGRSRELSDYASR